MPKTALTGAIVALILDRSGRQPLHQQVADGLRDAVRNGRLPLGTKLPSSRILADELGISRNVVLRAFEILGQEGTLDGRVGAGTFVMAAMPEPWEPLLDRGATASRSLFRRLSRRGEGILDSAATDFSERPKAFMPDVPDLRAFPIKTWMRLLNETSGRLTGGILVETDNAGYEPLRHAIAQYLNAARGMRCRPSQVIVTTGSQQSLKLVCRMLLDPGDPVWVEDPGYVGSRAVFGANGAVIYPVQVDEDGMCVERAIEESPIPRLVHVSPSRQYPLGGVMSLSRRHALLGIAQKNGTWIVEDDYDHEFRYEGSALQAVFALDREHRTFHIGTFSKILLPSLRLGYLVVPDDLIPAFAKARSSLDRHASLLEQMTLSEFMRRDLFISHVRRMRSLYRARQSRLIEGLHDVFDRKVPLGPTETGMHLTVKLRDGTDDRVLARRAAERGVVIRPLSPYYSARSRKQGFLFGFAAFDGVEIRRGLGLLDALRKELAEAVA